MGDDMELKISKVRAYVQEGETSDLSPALDGTWDLRLREGSTVTFELCGLSDGDLARMFRRWIRGE